MYQVKKQDPRKFHQELLYLEYPSKFHFFFCGTGVGNIIDHIISFQNNPRNGNSMSQLRLIFFLE